MRLLLVEDNPRLQSLLTEALNGAGYGVDMVSTVADLYASTAATAYDLIVLDLGLPDGDGLQAIRKLRTDGLATPILIITARGSIDERVVGLDAGADDYLTKPFNNNEFLARVRALLRRPQSVLGPVIEVGNTSMNLGNLEVTCSGKPVDLRFSERRLLLLMMRRARSLIPKSMLETSLSEFGRDISANAIEALVSRARRTLAEAGSDIVIETVRGVGYILKEKSQ
ncbi:MAG: response regulator [Proteobacteria bacterium]|nr:response regulator [Pseudomonadota bacterium]